MDFEVRQRRRGVRRARKAPRGFLRRALVPQLAMRWWRLGSWGPWSRLTLVVLTACNVVDGVPPGPKPAPRADAAIPCVAETEVCNGRDDDCDGQMDEAEAADAACRAQLVYRQTYCKVPAGLCIPQACHPGHFDCDGRPQNGCEAEAPCPRSPDEDAGQIESDGDNDAG